MVYFANLKSEEKLYVCHISQCFIHYWARLLEILRVQTNLIELELERDKYFSN